MLGRAAARMVTLVSAYRGVGKTSVAIHLAMALSARGARVLLIDENCGPANISGLLGLPLRFSLEHVMCGECRLEAALLPAAQGLMVLSAAVASHGSPARRVIAREQWAAGVRGIEARFDVVLVDTALDSAGGVSAFAGVNHDMIVVSSAAAQAVTASYALIKRLRDTGGERRFHVLLNRVTREENARVILENLTNVAHSHLHLSVESLGCVSKDDHLRFNSAEFQSMAVTQLPPPSAAQFHRIADAISVWPGPCARPGLMDRFMQRMLVGNPPLVASAGV